MLEPGDVVIAEFVGARETKSRPTIVISTALYNANRPDVILASLTTNTAIATTPTDYILRDWAQAGLKQPSAFRVYVGTRLASTVTRIGHLSDRDWEAIQKCLELAIAVHTG